MTKATSKAEALRRKKAKLPALAAIQRKEQHRVGGKFAKDDDPQKTARTARERQLAGMGSPKPHDDALSPLLGHQMGYVVRHLTPKREAQAKLWDTWQAYCQAERTYRMIFLGTTGEPQGASIQMVPEPMQTDSSYRVDLRTEAERQNGAVAAYMRWQGYLGCISKDGASLLRRAERGAGKPLWEDGKPTRAGLAAYAALVFLSKFHNAS